MAVYAKVETGYLVISLCHSVASAAGLMNTLLIFMLTLKAE